MTRTETTPRVAQRPAGCWVVVGGGGVGWDGDEISGVYIWLDQPTDAHLSYGLTLPLSLLYLRF